MSASSAVEEDDLADRKVANRAQQAASTGTALQRLASGGGETDPGDNDGSEDSGTRNQRKNDSSCHQVATTHQHSPSTIVYLALTSNFEIYVLMRASHLAERSTATT